MPKGLGIQDPNAYAIYSLLPIILFPSPYASGNLIVIEEDWITMIDWVGVHLHWSAMLITLIHPQLSNPRGEWSANNKSHEWRSIPMKPHNLCLSFK